MKETYLIVIPIIIFDKPKKINITDKSTTIFSVKLNAHLNEEG